MRRRKRFAEALWVLFAAGNLAAVLLVPGGETIPFHLIWVSLAVVYGVTSWDMKVAGLVLAAVTVLSGATLFVAVIDHGPGLDEIAEVPLMAVMFVAMIWYAGRKQGLAREVERLAEREREFTRDLAHELRTAVTIARGHAELIKNLSSDSSASEDAGVILDELDRLATISNHLLLLAGRSGPDFLHSAILDLEVLVDTAARRWRVVAPRDWQVDVAPGAAVVADGGRLESALDALLENAVKHTREQDSIAIRARGEGGNAVIEVSDTGDGIAPEHLSRIFDRFARTPGSRGSGLGLAIVKAIAEAHGGSVAVESVIGEGATFRICLPRLDPGPREAEGALAVPASQLKAIQT